MKIFNLLALTIVSMAASTAQASDRGECVRIKQIRAFAPESNTSLVVRQGASRFSRIGVEAGCAIDQADRIALAVGPRMGHVVGVVGTTPVVIDNSLLFLVCEDTPHADVVFIRDREEDRQRCGITSIDPATREDFEAAGEIVDNRF